MLIIGIILSFVGLVYLCWLLFALAVYALPLFAGAAAGIAAYHSSSGPMVAIFVGATAGAITLIAGQIAFTTSRAFPIRLAIALDYLQCRLLLRDIMLPTGFRPLLYQPKSGDRPWASWAQ